MPGIIDIVSGIVKPLTDLADEMHTSEEERLTARGVVLGVQASVLMLARLLAGESADVEGVQQVLEKISSWVHDLPLPERGE